MNSRQQGNLAVSKAITYYLSRGYEVSIPLGDTTRYDLIVDNGTLLKIQVKSTRYKRPSGNYQVSLRTCGGNQSWTKIHKYISNDEVDCVFVASEDGRMWEFPALFCQDKAHLSLDKGKDCYQVAEIAAS